MVVVSGWTHYEEIIRELTFNDLIIRVSTRISGEKWFTKAKVSINIVLTFVKFLKDLINNVDKLGYVYVRIRRDFGTDWEESNSDYLHV